MDADICKIETAELQLRLPLGAYQAKAVTSQKIEVTRRTIIKTEWRSTANSTVLQLGGSLKYQETHIIQISWVRWMTQVENPGKYRKFIRLYQSLIGPRVNDPRQWFYCLMNYCHGRAREAVKELAMPNSNAVLIKRARSWKTILRNHLG